MNYPGGDRYKDSFFKLLKQYAESHRRIRSDGKEVPWIDEVRHPLRDEWSCRKLLKDLGWLEWAGGRERGKDYNHSTFCDLIISGLVGVKYEDDNLTVNPCIPEEWEYFKLENLHFRGKTYSVIYDKTGEKYHMGKGITLQEI